MFDLIANTLNTVSQHISPTTIVIVMIIAIAVPSAVHHITKVTSSFCDKPNNKAYYFLAISSAILAVAIGIVGQVACEELHSGLHVSHWLTVTGFIAGLVIAAMNGIGGHYAYHSHREWLRYKLAFWSEAKEYGWHTSVDANVQIARFQRLLNKGNRS